MKPVIKILCITIFSLFLFFQMASAEETTPPESTIGIGQLMNNADQYPDNIMIQGIVSKVFPQDNLIGLIDNPNAQGCDVKKCTKPCPKASAKKCPIKGAKDSDKKCPMAAGKTCDKSCAKKCPKASGDSCCKTSAEAGSKACPMATPAEPGKSCPMTAGKKCTNPCPKSAAKACNDSDYTLTLPVHWDGDMPEPSNNVCVLGKITHKDGRLLFVAESIKVMSN